MSDRPTKKARERCGTGTEVWATVRGKDAGPVGRLLAQATDDNVIERTAGAGVALAA